MSAQRPAQHSDPTTTSHPPAPRLGVDRRTLLRGAGLLGAVAATGASLAPAQAAPAPTTVDPAAFRLTADYTKYTARVEALLDRKSVV